MIRINDCSENCSKSELDLFNLPPTQTDINSYKYKIIQPQSGWNDSEVINFVLEYCIARAAKIISLRGNLATPSGTWTSNVARARNSPRNTNGSSNTTM